MIKTDVIIVGGGPAGAACAWRLREHKIKCLILDQSVFPRGKPCAGWITPTVFKLLKINPDTYPASLTQFKSFQVSLRGVKFRLPTLQYAIRRIEFDAWLLSYAGFQPIHHKVEGIEEINEGYLIDGQYRSKFLVGAGGTHCPVRRTFFNHVRASHTQGLILAKEEEFVYPYSDDRCHLWFFEGGLPGYAWYVPKAGGYLNVGIGGSAAWIKSKGKTLNKYWQGFIVKLDKLGLVRGHPFNPKGYSYYLRGNSPRLCQGDVFLVGDSLGLATLDMGEGIGPAIQSGILAADAIKHNTIYSISSIPRFSFPSLLRLRK